MSDFYTLPTRPTFVWDHCTLTNSLIRDVIRLMTDTSNADACMMKVDRCMTRLHSLRGVVDEARIASVEVILGSLRSISLFVSK